MQLKTFLNKKLFFHQIDVGSMALNVVIRYAFIQFKANRLEIICDVNNLIRIIELILRLKN